MAKTTQTIMAKTLKVSQPFISQVINGRKIISWPLAEKLSDLFPDKNIRQWKNATAKELKKAFSQLKSEIKEVA